MSKEDCYWYVNKNASGEEFMKAMCLRCHEKNNDAGWFWQGSNLGYGDYDLQCNICNHIIYQRKNENTT